MRIRVSVGVVDAFNPLRLRRRLSALLALGALLIATFLFAVAGLAQAATAEQADIGMPFSGKWAYNVNVNPPYTDNNSSHPSVHLISAGADWAADIYGAQGQTARLHVTNATGNVTFSWRAASTSCGTATGVNVFVDGQLVGWIWIGHLVGAVKAGTITNGMSLGTVGNFTCAPGQHLHVEMKSDAGNFACWQDYGHPGASVAEAGKLGGLGATGATGGRQSCSAGSGTVGDGSFVRTPDGNIYRIAGGAPVYVSDCAPFAGCPNYTNVSSLGGYRDVPRDGTLINGAHRGEVYRIAGGAPLYVSNWNVVGGPQPTVAVDDFSIDNAGAGGVFNHLRYLPADGTLINGGGRGEVYRIAGGAPVYVSNWNVVGGPQPTTSVDDAAIDNAGGGGPWSHLRYVPADGTFINGGGRGEVYRIAGGAPLYVSTWNIFGGPQPTTSVDDAAIDNAGGGGRWSHLNSAPVDGTFLRGLPSGQYWLIAGGTRQAASGGSGAVDVDDVAVSRISVPDSTAPDVTSVDPFDGMHGVALSTNITVTFSEDVRGVSGGTLFLNRAGNAPDVSATVSYDPATRTATLDPTSDLLIDTEYVVNMSLNGQIVDIAGNPLLPKGYKFTTGPSPTVMAVAPADGTASVSVSTNITATFSEPVAGVDSSVFILTDVSGATVPATVAYDAGTRTAILDPTTNLAPGVRYDVALWGGTQIRDSAENGLIPGKFWSFTTGSGDSVIPVVSSRAPVSNAVGVGIGANATATFSEPVQGVSSSTFVLRNPAGAVIAAPVTYNATTRVATLNPSANLASDTRYTAALIGGSSAIRDLAGNSLSATTWTFTTGPRPTVTARTPAAGATLVSRTVNVTATFSEPVRGVGATAVKLVSSAGTPVTAMVTCNATTRVVTLDPSVTLAANMRYTATLTGGATAIRDIAGNPLTTISWSFTTRA